MPPKVVFYRTEWVQFTLGIYSSTIIYLYGDCEEGDISIVR